MDVSIILNGVEYQTSKEELQKVASILVWLEPYNKDAWLRILKVSEDELIEVVFDTVDDSLGSIELLCKFGIRIDTLLLSKKAMGPYFIAETAEKYSNSIEFLLNCGSMFDILVFYRAAYRFGVPAMEDKEWDLLEKMYVNNVKGMELLRERTYDDDDEFYTPIVMEAFKLGHIGRKGNKLSRSTLKQAVQSDSVYQELDSDKSTSIKPVDNVNDLFDFIQRSPHCDLHFSLKIDGVNTKVMFDENGKGLLLALSRGRASNSFDYTEAISAELRLLNVDTSKLHGKLVGESFVDKEGVRVLNAKYPEKNYRSPKSAGMAMLRSPQNFDVEDIKWLHTIFFNYNDLLVDKAFEELSNCGLEVPYSIVVKAEEVPRTLGEFSMWLDREVLVPMMNKQEELNLSADGVVLQLLTHIDSERKDVYSDSNVAIKFGHWASANYVSCVKGVVFEQRSVEASVVVLIEPVTTRDGNVATRVAGLSTAILIRDGVRIGDYIEFTRKSEAYNTYVRKVDSGDRSVAG